MSQFDFQKMISRPELEKHLDEPRNLIALENMLCDEVYAQTFANLMKLSREIVKLPPGLHMHSGVKKAMGDMQKYKYPKPPKTAG